MLILYRRYVETGVMLKYYKVYEDAIAPSYATPDSACFDLRAYVPIDEVITFYSDLNEYVNIKPNEQRQIVLRPRWRTLIPTGLIFDIPVGYSVRVHPRSGIALKQGLTLINCSGIIDQDYTAQSYITLFNASDAKVVITHGERLCQAELFQDIRVPLEETTTPPSPTNRTGGFGSTGV